LRLHNLLELLALLLLLLQRSCRQSLLRGLDVSCRLAWLLLLPLLLCRLVLTTLLPLLLLLARPLPLPLLLLVVVARPLPLRLLLPLTHRPTVAALDASAVCVTTCTVIVPAAATPAAKGHTAASELARLATSTTSSCLGPVLVWATAYPKLPSRHWTVAPGCLWVSAAVRGLSASMPTFAA
jgi:hypothetical protein